MCSVDEQEKDKVCFNVHTCPYFVQDEFGGECAVYKEYEGYSRSCRNNDRLDFVCHVRRKYYRSHPEEFIQFGKYKYCRYLDLPNSYIAWLLKDCTLMESTRKSLEDAVLEKRRKETVSMFIKDCYKSHNMRSSYSPSSFSSYGCGPTAWEETMTDVWEEYH